VTANPFAQISLLNSGCRIMPNFDCHFREQLYTLFSWRRDVRRFLPTPIPLNTLDRLLDLACLAPSVGLSQPWRFITVDDASRRAAIRVEFERCNADALAAEPHERAAHYARLKLAGLDEAPVHVAVYADSATTQGHGLGRRTMPETIAYSAVMAVHTLWLAARAEGIGVGWVSILEPSRIAAVLDVPSNWTFIGYLCLGYPQQQDDVPALEPQRWECRRLDADIFRLKR
jgi:5,6-dimethylbenzimidazole synthase